MRYYGIQMENTVGPRLFLVSGEYEPRRKCTHDLGCVFSCIPIFKFMSSTKQKCSILTTDLIFFWIKIISKFIYCKLTLICDEFIPRLWYARTVFFKVMLYQHHYNVDQIWYIVQKQNAVAKIFFLTNKCNMNSTSIY